MRAAKTDTNQAEIVAALREAGASVQLLHRVGEGCPDLLVGFKSRDGVGRPTWPTNLVVEVKDGTLIPSERKLNPRQQKWHADWRGQVAVVENVAEALALIGVTI